MAPTPSSVTSGGDGKRSYVKAMFTAIAPRYDLLNHALSLNIDRSWRRRAVRRVGWEERPAGCYLDLCAGTLDLSAELASRDGFHGRVVAADFVLTMLRQGRAKARTARPVAADALALPFPDASFDGCMVGFGVRNLADLEGGLREMARVLRSGARVVVLEFGLPEARPLRAAYLAYFRHVLPRVGRWVSKHTSAYSYLPHSVADFPPPPEFREMLREAGFTGVADEALTFGVARLFWATRT
jgi:demethylmenaquinone methyltransferase/2-methoxy-6-polyprenyl-1,4-benzoquinol methylase